MSHENSNGLYGRVAAARAAAGRRGRLAAGVVGAVLVLEAREAARQYFAPLTPRFVGLLAFAVLLTGCTSSNFTEMVKALGKDEASVCITAVYAGANFNFARTNIQNGDISCNTNGLTVKSQATQVGVPMTITPELSIGQPTLRQSPPAKAAPPAVVPQSAPVKPMSWLVEPPDRIRDILSAHHAFFATPPQQR